MPAILVVTRGKQKSERFPLDPTKQNKLGRGTDCEVQINDPLWSRVHAVVSFHEGQWQLKDAGSRNGTFVNAAKVDEAVLITGSRIRIGNIELELIDQSSSDAATSEAPVISQTLVHDIPMSDDYSSVSAVKALSDSKRAQDLLDLYQMTFRLLSIDEPTEVADIGLSVLKARTKATVVGILWSDSEGHLRPHQIIPPSGEGHMRLAKKLTELVCTRSHAIWIKNEKSLGNGPLKAFADAVCVPLLSNGKTIGAIHVYRENEEFSEYDFDFIVSASNVISAALNRAQLQKAVQASRDHLVEKSADFDELIGESRPMQELKQRITRVASASGCVLIRGESGSGKELVARAIHRASPRAHRTMLSVNCAAIPSELMESQLFGHRKGAFTGADKDHIGWFQQADTGTLFLDEIGELTLDGQAKLLRILEGHPFLPVGATKEIRVDVRVIAATNRDLKEFVREKRFREDLFYRLSVFEMWIPPVRDRAEDIGLLIDHFFDHFRRMHGRTNLTMSDTARRRLLSYQWPGNVRQLRNVIDSAVVLAAEDEISAHDFGLQDVQEMSVETLNIEAWENRLIREALQRTKWNMPEAAELLGISRATLYRKIGTYDIKRDA